MVHDPAAKADLLRLVHLGDKPGVAQAKPVVGQLHLLAVNDLLLEDAQLIADGIAGGRDLQSGHGVQVAGGQTTQTAIAQAGVWLGLEQVSGGKAQILQHLGQGVQQPQIIGVLLQRAAHQEFQREVVDLPALGFPDVVAGLDLMTGHDIPQDHGAGLEHMIRGGLIHCAAKIPQELAHDHLSELGFVVFSHNLPPC